MKHFNIEETIRTSSTETEDNPKKKTTQNKNHKKPLYFHQDGKFCGMDTRKKPRTKSRPRNLGFDE